jgi:outer membrane lipoprotein-sorting protein
VIRTLCLVVLAAVSLAGCGGSGASGVVADTGANLAKIHSGVLDLALTVTPHDGGKPFGFELRGPFSFGSGGLPVARITYTQTANGGSASATFVSNGRRAWIVSPSGTRTLSAAEARSLSMSGTLSGLDIGDWVKHPSVERGPGGTDVVRGTVDVVAAANGLSGVAALAGKSMPAIEGDDAKRLESAARATSVELVTTKRDRLLRRLAMTADLGFSVPASLRAALGSRVGAKIDFRLRIARPNSRVVVTGP